MSIPGFFVVEPAFTGTKPLVVGATVELTVGKNGKRNLPESFFGASVVVVVNNVVVEGLAVVTMSN